MTHNVAVKYTFHYTIKLWMNNSTWIQTVHLKMLKASLSHARSFMWREILSRLHTDWKELLYFTFQKLVHCKLWSISISPSCLTYITEITAQVICVSALFSLQHLYITVYVLCIFTVFSLQNIIYITFSNICILLCK